MVEEDFLAAVEGRLDVVDIEDVVERNVLEIEALACVADEDALEDILERYEPGVQPRTEPSGLSMSHHP